MDLDLKTISSGASVRNQKSPEAAENNSSRSAATSSYANTGDELKLTDEALILRKLQNNLQLVQPENDRDGHVSEIAKSVKAGLYQPDFNKVAASIITQESQFFSKGNP